MTTNETYLERPHQRTGKPFPLVRSSPDQRAGRCGESVSALRAGRPHVCCFLGIADHQDGVANVRGAARVILTQAPAGPAAYYVTRSGNPQADCRAFAKAIVDPTRRSMGRYGRHRIEGELGWSAQATRYLNAYDSLLRHDPAAGNGVLARAAA